MPEWSKTDLFEWDAAELGESYLKRASAPSARFSSPPAGASAASVQSARRRQSRDSLDEGEERADTKRRRFAHPMDQYEPTQPWPGKSPSPSTTWRAEHMLNNAGASGPAAYESDFALYSTPPVAQPLGHRAALSPTMPNHRAADPRSSTGPLEPHPSILNAAWPDPTAAGVAAPATGFSAAFMAEIASIFAEECGGAGRPPDSG